MQANLLSPRSAASGLAFFGLLATLPIGHAQVSSAPAQPGHATICRFGAPPCGPGSIEPTTGDVDTEITMQGNFSAIIAAGTQPEDLFMTSASDRGFIGIGTDLSAQSATCALTDVHAFPASDAPEIRVGTGVRMNIPSLDGFVTYPEPMWGWRRSHGGPTFVATETFTPTPNFLNQPCDGVMPRKIWSQFRLEGGCLRAAMPGPQSCTGDELAVVLEFTTAQDEIANVLRPTSGLPPLPWINAAAYLTWPLNFYLPNVGCVASYDFSANELVICPIDPVGNPITGVSRKSFLILIPDETQYTLHEDINGDEDDFVYSLPADMAMPSSAFDSWVDLNYVPPSLRDYDQGGLGRWLVDTLDDFGKPEDGFVRAAVLELHIIGAEGGRTDTDHVRIGWKGTAETSMEYVKRFEDLAILSHQWQPGDEATFALNLNILPGVDGQLTDVLDVFELADELDIVIDDDTIVDYAKLKVWRCTP